MTSESGSARKQYCWQSARKLLHAHRIVAPPVQVEEIARAEGFTVKYISGEARSFSGILHRDLKAIGINADHPKVRQRFSIAHELGHYFLDHPQEDEGYETDDGASLWKTCESEANEFAGELLVPGDLLAEAVKAIKKVAIDAKLENLAQLFNASREVIVIQLTKHRLMTKL